MIGLLQRVRCASVEVEGKVVSKIGVGLLVFIGIERGDGEPQARRMVERLLGYRVFSDKAGRMNRSLRDIENGGLLLVSQFTLAADTDAGMRPSFTPAAAPPLAHGLYDFLVDTARTEWSRTSTGLFGADMQISLVNDGPVTFQLKT